MKKITAHVMEQHNKIKRKWQASEKVIPMWLGIILFAVVAILSFMLIYVSQLSDDTETIVWNYAFVRNVGESVDEDSWIKTESYAELPEPNGAYIYLTHIFEESDTDRILYILTDHTPMQVYMDREVIYDNHFDSEEYVGNRYNAIVIPAGQSRLIDIYMTQPFSGEFSSYIEDASQDGNPAYSFVPLLWPGAALTAIGLIAFIVSLFFVLKDRKYKRFVAVPLVAVILGGKIFIEQLDICTYMLNESFWYNLRSAMPFFALCVMLFNLILIIGASKKTVACLSVYAVLSLLMLTVKSAAFVKWGCIALYAMGLVIIFILCFELSKKSIQRVQYAMACFSIAVFTLCAFASVAVIDIFSFTDAVAILDIFVLIVYLIFLYFVHFRSITDPNEDYSDISRCCDQWVKAFPSHVERIYSANSMSEFAVTAIEEMCDIVDRAARELSDSSYELVKACVALHTDGGFKELYNRGLNEKCDFDKIVEYYSHTGKKIFVCESYFDFIFCCNGQAHVIFHFENILPQVSEFISGIGYIEYAVMDVSINRFFSDMNEEQTFACQQTAFSEAASFETYEKTSASEHISNVVFFTKILCDELGLDVEESNIVSSASALHDIGKFAIPQELIQKSGNLCKEERDMIDKHAQYGYELLSSLPGKYMNVAAYIALLHHSYYSDPVPDGIDEKYILYARIVSVADVYDALTSKRNYKDAWDFDRAYVYLNELSGKKFDPIVIQAFNKRSQDFAALRKGE